ncbi:MAG: hypothetical protein NVS1B14_06900 [Vulcanimicrobiaceae bacterium]
MALAGLSAAVEYARKHHLHALLVVHGNDLVHEEYAQGYTATRPHALYSGTKSFWGVCAAAAVDDGILTIDEPACETIEEWRGDPIKSLITIRELLNLTAGLPFGGLGAGVPAFNAAIAKPLADRPGTTFTYGGIPLQVFGALLSRKLATHGQTPLDYLQQRIFNPIGVRYASWRTLPDGTHTMPTGAFFTARAWLDFGRFLQQRGCWNGAQIISRQSIEACWVGSAVNPRYGLAFWIERFGGDRPAVAYASGSGKQALYVALDDDIVAVHFSQSRNYRHERFLALLLGRAARVTKSIETRAGTPLTKRST